MRPRSALLAAATALLLVTAGCVATPGGPSTPTDATAESPTTTDSATSATTTVPGTPLAWPDGPKERPDRPATLTRSSVREFVYTTEYRYVYNSLWYDETSEVHAECEVDSVTRESGAWRAVVTCTAYSNSGGERENGTGTSTMVHADYFTQTWVYWITDDSVHRVESDQ